jgi:uncharacterized repeat protein (TIGR01451 family)
MGRRLRTGRRISVLISAALLGLAALWSGGALAQTDPLANPESGGDVAGTETPTRDAGEAGRVAETPPGGELPGEGDPGDTPPRDEPPVRDPGGTGGGTGGGGTGGGGIGGGGTGTQLVPGVDLALTKTDSPDPVNSGDNLTYTIAIVNNGDTAAPNAQMTDQLPQVAPGPITTTQGSCTPGSFVTCNFGTIASGATVTVTITVQVPPSTAPGTLSNTAEVHSEASEGDTSNNADTETTTVTTSADLAVVKDVSATASQGACSGTPLVCTLGDIDAGASVTITIVVHVDPSVPDGTELANTATVDSETSDPELGERLGDGGDRGRDLGRPGAHEGGSA